MRSKPMMIVAAISITFSVISYVAISGSDQSTNAVGPATTRQSSAESSIPPQPAAPQGPTFLTFEIPADWSEEERRLMQTLQAWDCRRKPELNSQNSERVVKVIEEFVAKSDSDAIVLLGSLCLNGWVVASDEGRGMDLLRKARDLGNRKAVPICAEIIFGFSDDPKEQLAALQTLRKCAEAGDTHTQAELAQIYYFGHRTEKNSDEAVRWFVAAIKANPENDFMIPVLILATSEATPTVQVRGEIQTLLMSRATNGSTHAIMGLGKAYETGALGSKDVSQAIHWYEKAMKLDVPEAFAAMGSLIMNRANDRMQQKAITDGEYAEAQSLYRALFAKGAELGDEHAKMMLNLTAPRRFTPDTGYSMESMLIRASEDALLDAAGLERVR